MPADNETLKNSDVEHVVAKYWFRNLSQPVEARVFISSPSVPELSVWQDAESAYGESLLRIEIIRDPDNAAKFKASTK